MKKRSSHRLHASGISLVETIVSMGVLAVVIPLVLAAILKAGVTGSSARAETRAPAIADFCMVELRAAREGTSEYFPKVEAGAAFGSSGSFMGLGFGRDGAVLGDVTRAQFDEGLAEIGNEQVYYVARISGNVDTTSREVDLVTVTVDVEYPATKSSDKRSKASFHTKLP
ncbi:type IV pilus modification PilV family protein [Haloferula sp.]|uniref:type IV pilus modification PilV family protein n=1 Tax=Haloferula sp. TaxID=2497595 RepID=UPI003C76D056